MSIGISSYSPGSGFHSAYRIQARASQEMTDVYKVRQARAAIRYEQQSGGSIENVVQRFISDGVDPQTAQRLVHQALNTSEDDDLRKISLNQARIALQQQKAARLIQERKSANDDVKASIKLAMDN